MNYVWGSLVILIGLFFIVSAFMKSEFFIYKVLTARSKLLWKDNVHNFYKVTGVLLVIFGALIVFNVIPIN